MKKAIFNIVIFFRRPSIINRLILLGGAMLILTLNIIPELKFNLISRNPPRLTVEEIRKTPLSTLPRYIVLENAQLMKVRTELSRAKMDSLLGIKQEGLKGSISLVEESYNYVSEMRIKDGDTSLTATYYPVYSTKEVQNNPDALASELVSYVLVKDSQVTRKMLEGEKYFKDSSFTIQGKFDGKVVGMKTMKLLNESGYNISKEAIVLQRVGTPASLTSALIGTILVSLFGMFCILGLLPITVLHKIFGIEHEVIELKH
jgi:hypothetical protein